jgi:hypothetical protein
MFLRSVLVKNPTFIFLKTQGEFLIKFKIKIKYKNNLKFNFNFESAVLKPRFFTGKALKIKFIKINILFIFIND